MFLTTGVLFHVVDLDLDALHIILLTCMATITSDAKRVVIDLLTLPARYLDLVINYQDADDRIPLQIES